MDGSESVLLDALWYCMEFRVSVRDAVRRDGRSLRKDDFDVVSMDLLKLRLNPDGKSFHAI